MFCPWQGKDCVSVFSYLLRYSGLNFFIVLLCKWLTFLNDAFELYSNRTLKNERQTIQGNFSCQWPVASLTSRNKPFGINSLWWTSLFLSLACVAWGHQTPVQSRSSCVSSCTLPTRRQGVASSKALFLYQNAFKCWLYVLGSLKRFLFPSCCSEQFCFCLLRISPALASEQQTVNGICDFWCVPSESNTSSLVYNQRTDIMKLYSNIWKHNPFVQQVTFV